MRSPRARLGAAALNGSVLVLSNARRLLFSSLSGLLAISSVALGTYAGFSAQTSGPGNTISTGSVAIVAELGGPNATGTPTPFSFGTVADMVPGETVVKFLDVTRTGTLDFSLKAAAIATPTSLLDSHPTNRLRLTIERCPSAWTAINTCAGSIEMLYNDGPLAPLTGTPSPGTTVPLGVVTTAAGSVAHLQISVTLPSTATALNGLSSTIQFTWTASSL